MLQTDILVLMLQKQMLQTDILVTMQTFAFNTGNCKLNSFLLMSQLMYNGDHLETQETNDMVSLCFESKNINSKVQPDMGRLKKVRHP